MDGYTKHITPDNNDPEITFKRQSFSHSDLNVS